jgi:hypothetical protein
MTTVRAAMRRVRASCDNYGCVTKALTGSVGYSKVCNCTWSGPLLLENECLGWVADSECNTRFDQGPDNGVEGRQLLAVSTSIHRLVDVRPGQATVAEPQKAVDDRLIVPSLEAKVGKRLLLDLEQRAPT